MKIALTLTLLVTAILAPSFAKAADEPLKDCPWQKIERYASVRGGIYHHLGREIVKIKDIDAKIPVYEPFAGNCMKTPDPGSLGAFHYEVDGRKYEMVPSAELNLRAARGEYSATKVIKARVWANAEASGTKEAESFILISGHAGSEDLGWKNLQLVVDGRRIPGHRFEIVLNVYDHESK